MWRWEWVCWEERWSCWGVGLGMEGKRHKLEVCDAYLPISHLTRVLWAPMGWSLAFSTGEFRGTQRGHPGFTGKDRDSGTKDL